MLEELLPYYNQELGSIRELANEFAKIYPKVAGHLSISSGKIEDPDLARMIEAFAFLTAHVRYKIEDDFPEIAESLLSVLHPYYLAPIPSFSIIQLNPKPELPGRYEVPKGAMIDTGSVYEEPCNFTTIYDVELWPIEVSYAKACDQPFKAPLIDSRIKNAKGLLHIVLNYHSPKMKFSETPPERLVFFINAQDQDVYKIYTAIFEKTLVIALANSSTDEKPIFLNKDNIKPIGFNSEETLLPYFSHVAQGYELLTEYFAFPEKFLFFELSGLNVSNLSNMGNRLEIFFYMKDPFLDLTRRINASMFKLGCTPIVNLFSHIAEPIHLTHTKPEYKIISDSRRSKLGLEIHTVNKVSLLTENGENLRFSPFYGIKHHREQANNCYFWKTSRRAKDSDTSDLYISFSDLDYQTMTDSEGVVHIETLCTNGDLPSLLPISKTEPFFQFSTKGAPVTNIGCLMPFSSSIRKKLRDGVRWKLISHLSLNFFSLAQVDKGTDILKEILRLYNFKDTAETHAIIDSIISVICKTITSRGPAGSRNALCQGIEITLQVENAGFVGNGLYLFGCILDKFFARYATMNSFTKLIISTQKDGILYQWPARAGNKSLL